MTRRTYHSINGEIREGPHPDNLKRRGTQIVSRGGQSGGISFQFPANYGRETGRFKYVESGPFKGRVRFDSRRGAKEIAKVHEGETGEKVHYDP